MFTRCACLALVLVLGAPCLQGAPIWKRAEPAPSQAKLLEDLQSPLHAHEHRVVADTPRRIGKEQFAFAVDASGRTATWTRTSTHHKKDKRSKDGRFRVPGYVTLSVGLKRGYTLRARVLEGALLLSSATGLDLPCGGGLGHLVDSDLDGVFGSAGDGYVAPESRTVGPFSGQAWGPKGGLRYRRKDDASWQRAVIAFPRPLDGDHCAAWSLLQWRRQQCGCLPVEYDLALEEGIRKHVAYIARHGTFGHDEDPKKLGYTPEGARAAQNCIIGRGDVSLLGALRMHLSTLYHRTPPLQPELTHTALHFAQGVSMMDVISRRGGALKDAVLVYPPHGMQHVPPRFNPAGENPMPVRGAAWGKNQLGTPVAVYSAPLVRATSLVVEPSITVRRAERRKRDRGLVEGHFHFPGNPPSTAVGPSNRGIVALIPKALLRAKTRHDGFARIALPDGTMFVYSWWFETRKQASRRR